MNNFLGLLAAIVGLMTVITLSIMELWVIPWPILLILLLLTLWASQRLIDRFNPSPVGGISTQPVQPDSPVSLLKQQQNPEFSPDLDQSSESAHFQYRGQMYEETTSSDGGEEAIQAAKPTCYRGVRLQDQDSAPERSEQPPADRPHPQLSYRGIKRPSP